MYMYIICTYIYIYVYIYIYIYIRVFVCVPVCIIYKPAYYFSWHNSCMHITSLYINRHYDIFVYRPRLIRQCKTLILNMRCKILECLMWGHKILRRKMLGLPSLDVCMGRLVLYRAQCGSA